MGKRPRRRSSGLTMLGAWTAAAALTTFAGLAIAGDGTEQSWSAPVSNDTVIIGSSDSIPTNFVDIHENANKDLQDNKDTLLLLPQVKNRPFADKFMEALNLNGQMFLPLEDLIHIFGFAIDIDSTNDIAKGFFIAPENTFDLNAETLTVRIGQQSWGLTRNDIRKKSGKLYISLGSLTNWFGIGSDIDLNNATIHFTTDKLLPQDIEEARHHKWEAIKSGNNINLPEIAVLQRPSTNRNDDTASEKGDTSRSLAAKAVLMNDLAAMSQGTVLRNFSGKATAGYDVELYRNDVLVAFQTVGANGEYSFTNIPVPFGENTFHLELYGPLGQREEKIETVADFRPMIEEKQGTANIQPSNSTAASTTKPINLPSPATKPIAKPPPEIKAVASNPRPSSETPDDNSPSTTPLKNWSKFSIVRNNQTLGTVSTYIDLKGTFLGLDRLLRAIGLSYKRQDAPDTITIVFTDGQTVLLDLQTHEYVENGQRHALYDNDAFVNEGQIFVNVTLLNRILPPYEFVEDLALREIVVSEGRGNLLGLWSTPPENKSDLAPPPLPAPVQPVIIDNLPENEQQPGTPLAPKTPEREAPDVLHLAQPSPETAPPPPSAEQAPQPETKKNPASEKTGEPPPTTTQQPANTAIFAEEEQLDENGTLILQPWIKNLAPSNEFIEALNQSGEIFLPLNDLIQILEFPMKIDQAKHSVSGFFIAPENEFNLDIEKNTVRVGSQEWPVTPKDILMKSGQIYISTESFAKWFGINCDINRKDATLHFTTDKMLPQELEEERQKRWQKMMAAIKESDKDFPLLQNSYQAIGYPAVDVNIGSIYSHSASSSTSSNKQEPFVSAYNLQGSMDLAYMTSQFFAQGTTNGKIMNALRFNIGRKDPDSNLLDFLHATEFSLGDITSTSVSLVTSNSLGRGFSFTNKPLNSSENFDYRNFTGDSVPGYEVELYRNNVLITFQTVDSSGRYNFTNIPILYGENTFRLVFYGPQGQREEKTETVSAFNSLLKENEFVYTLAANQRGKSLIPVNKSNSMNPNAPPGIEAVGSIRYGLTRSITVGTSVAETKLADGEHRYATAMTGANIGGVLTEANVAKDFTNGGWAGSLSALGGFQGVSLRGKYRRFNNFLSESINNFDSPLSSDASLDANTQFYLPILGNYNVGLSALRETFVDKSRVPRYTYSWRSSKSVWGLSFTDSVDYVIDESKRIQDTFGVQTRFWNVDWRAVGIYNLKPERQFRDATFMADYRFTDRLSGQTQIEKDLTANNRTTVGQSLTWDFDNFRLSFNGQMDNNSEYSVGMNLLLSLNHDDTADCWRVQPHQTSGGGAVSGRVFVDDNNNNNLDEGEKIVEDAKIRVNRTPAKLGPDGYFVAPVTPYEISRVELEATSIQDPLLTPARRGYHIMTRPGDTVIADFPLVHTTIVDGKIVFLDDQGATRELGDIVVELQDKDGKPLQRVISGIDGYFSFDKVGAGEYWLTVPEEALAAVNATVDNKIHIVLKEINDFVTGKDIVLHQKEKLNGPPSFALPPPEQPPSNDNQQKPQGGENLTAPKNSSSSTSEAPQEDIKPAAATAQIQAADTAVSPNSKDDNQQATPEKESPSVTPAVTKEETIKKSLHHYAPPSWPGLSELADRRLSEDKPDKHAPDSTSQETTSLDGFIVEASYPKAKKM